MTDSQQPFITDLGESKRLYDGDTGEVVGYVPRYGVWCFDRYKGKMQVHESSDDVAYLQAKYHVADDRVVPLGRKQK